MRITSEDGRSAPSLLSSCVGTAVCVTDTYIAIDKHAQYDYGVKCLAELRSRPWYQRTVIGDALSNAQGDLHDRVSHTQDICNVSCDVCKVASHRVWRVAQRGNCCYDRAVGQEQDNGDIERRTLDWWMPGIGAVS